MIRFFRQIRQNMITESRFSKYLLYAIGEILLVVIGILIALQVNNWNEERKDRRSEKKIIENLKQEFLVNQSELDHILSVVNKSRDANLQLMDFFGASKAELEKANIDSLVFYSVEFERFIPTQNAISDLLQSGKLQLLSNKELKNQLYNWARVMGQIEESYSGVKEKAEDGIVPYLTPLYPLKDIDKYGILQWKSSSKLPNNKLQVFTQIEYENLTDDHLYRLLRYENNLKKARGIIGEILLITGK